MRYRNLTSILFPFCRFPFRLCDMGRKSMRYFLLGILAMTVTNTAWGDLDWVDQSRGTTRLKSMYKEAQREQGGSAQYSSPAVQLPPQIDQIEQIGLAARQGNTDAYVALGAFYRGIGNETEATRWFAMAAAQGHPKAQLFLGYRYLYGIGAPKNPILAEDWLRQAANQGEQAAQEMLLHQAAVQGEKATRDAIKAMSESIK